MNPKNVVRTAPSSAEGGAPPKTREASCHWCGARNSRTRDNCWRCRADASWAQRAPDERDRAVQERVI
jgi:hypothetical protein